MANWLARYLSPARSSSKHYRPQPSRISRSTNQIKINIISLFSRSVNQRQARRIISPTRQKLNLKLRGPNLASLLWTNKKRTNPTIPNTMTSKWQSNNGIVRLSRNLRVHSKKLKRVKDSRRLIKSCNNYHQRPNANHWLTSWTTSNEMSHAIVRWGSSQQQRPPANRGGVHRYLPKNCFNNNTKLLKMRCQNTLVKTRRPTCLKRIMTMPTPTSKVESGWSTTRTTFRSNLRTLLQWELVYTSSSSSSNRSDC